MLRTPSRRIACAGMSVALAFGALVHVAVAQADESDVVVPPSEAALFAEAAATGERVEIEAQRTQTDTVYASPDGLFVREVSSAPIRVKQDGEWTPVDLDLEVGEDGLVRPKAAPGRVAFSNGGDDAPLESVTHEGVTLKFGWPGELPVPTLDGQTATYADVLPGVDLRLAMTDGGPSQVLVVKDAQAAANPDLKSLELSTEVVGGSLEQDGQSLSLFKDDGSEVAVTPPATMWDSSGAVLSDSGTPLPDGSDTAVDARTQGPADGDRVATVDMDLSEDALTLEPSASLMTGSSVQYPLYVDPSVATKVGSWAMVFMQHPTLVSYKWSNDDLGQGVGFQDYNGSSTKRLFWQFRSDYLDGSTVASAQFQATMVWSASCSPTTTELYRTSTISSSTNWSSQPAIRDSNLVDSVKDAAGRKECYPNGRLEEWNIKSAAQAAANSGADRMTFAMKAYDESNRLSWKRFNNDAKLVIAYANAPYRPSSLTINGTACGSEAVKIRRSTMFTAKARFSDPDDGDMIADFQWDEGATFNSETLRKWPSKSFNGPLYQAHDLDIAKGQGGLSPGVFRVRGRDDNSLGLTSPWVTCKFVMDDVLAPTPTVEVETEEWDSTSPTSVTFVPAVGGEADTAKFAYQWDIDKAPSAGTLTASEAGHKRTVSLTPPSPGLHTLYVWAFDAAGNPSEDPGSVKIEVQGFTPDYASRYLLTEGSGTTAADSYRNFDLALTNPSWIIRSYSTTDDETTIPRKALSFGGTPLRLGSTSGAVIPLSSGASWTQSVWLNPTGFPSTVPASDKRVAISVGTTTTTATRIGVKPTDGAYRYYAEVRQTDGTVATLLSKKNAATLGPVNIQLSYDEKDHALTMIVYSGRNGVVVEERTLSADGESISPTQMSTTGFRIGADWSSNTTVTPWTGWIDDIHIGKGTLSDIQSRLLFTSVANNWCDTIDPQTTKCTDDS